MSLKKKSCRDWRLYVITDPAAAGSRPLEGVVEAALRGGADAVQLRDKTASDEDLTALGRKMLALTRAAGASLIINDRPGVALAVGADGVHLGQEDGPLSAARALLGQGAVIGRSTHSPDQALAAEKEGFDYIGIGPVYGTPTKPSYKPVGLELVRFASEHIGIPFVAIGGIDADNVRTVREAGAGCVAVVRCVMSAEDPRGRAESLRRSLA